MSEVTKVAVVTGGTGGVGQATSNKLHAMGYKVYATDIKAPGEDSELAQGIEYRQHDVASESDWSALMADIDQAHGRLDVLVNNAAILMALTLEEQSLESFKRIFDVNCSSVFLGMKHALPLLRASGAGSIINMSSSSGIQGYHLFAAYGATKAAVRNLTQSTAVYCHANDYPVRCNSVHPDGILSNMVANMAEGTLPEMDEQQGLKAFKFACMPDAVADVICFLAGEGARHINGAAICVDNSSTIQMPYF